MSSRELSDMVPLFVNFGQRRGDGGDHRRKSAETNERIGQTFRNVEFTRGEVTL